MACPRCHHENRTGETCGEWGQRLSRSRSTITIGYRRKSFCMPHFVWTRRRIVGDLKTYPPNAVPEELS